MSAMESTPNTPDLSTVADLSDAPIPTARTLGMRRNIPYQFGRFVAMNLRILRMAKKGH